MPCEMATSSQAAGVPLIGRPGPVPLHVQMSLKLEHQWYRHAA